MRDSFGTINQSVANVGPIRLRIRKANELVKQGMTDAATVAKAIGFNDPAYFENVYLRYTGTVFNNEKTSRHPALTGRSR